MQDNDPKDGNQPQNAPITVVEPQRREPQIFIETGSTEKKSESTDKSEKR